jgi:hypothetical protein
VAATLVGSGSPHHPTLTRTPMTSAQVLQLLESAPRLGTRQVARLEPIPARWQAQKFAVLSSGHDAGARDPFRSSQFSRPSSIRSRSSVKAGAGTDFAWDSLKIPSARQVALYARSDFSAAAVVPVSDRECAQAGGVAAARSQRQRRRR